MDKYNANQFEMLGIMNTGEENKGICYPNTPHGRPVVNGKEKIYQNPYSQPSSTSAKVLIIVGRQPHCYQPRFLQLAWRAYQRVRYLERRYVL